MFVLLLFVTPLVTAAEFAGNKSLVVDELVYDFGCVGMDFEIVHFYKLTNTDQKAVKIDSVKTLCECSRVRLADSVLAPGDTTTIRLEFDTRDYYGGVQKGVRVFYGKGDGSKITMFWTAIVGQWLYKVKPEPISLFFLPGQTSKKSTFLNTDLESIEIIDVEALDDLITVQPVKTKAETGKAVELVITTREDIKPGTYHTNFRVSFDVGEDAAENSLPLRITIPAKIVRY